MWYGSLMNAYLDKTDSFMRGLGLDTYRVGGSVRDELLGRRVKDADYMVKADLGTIYDALMRETSVKVSPLKLRDGRQAGWRVSGRGLGGIEIVLPREEISTGPGHRDFKIVLNPELSLEQDAIRRDFTFNALYRRVSDERLFDPTGNGVEDLARRRIQVTHADSFRDDPLRTLRALRFVSVLGYDMAAETHLLMQVHAEHVNGLTSNGYASGTVLDEMSKLLMGQDPAKALRLARDTGVLGRLFVELDPMLGFDQKSRYHDLSTDEHTFKTLETAAHVDAPLHVRWALLFHDSGKPESAWEGEDGRLHYYGNPKLGKRDHQDTGADIWIDASDWMNVPRDLQNTVERLIRNHMVPCSKANRTKVVKARMKFGDELLRDLYLMRMCDLTGKGKANLAHLAVVKELESMRSDMQKAGVPREARDLKINGTDVIEAGGTGRQIGEALSAVVFEVALDHEGPRGTREWQIEAVKRALS